MNAGQFIGSEEILSGDEFSLYNPANNEPVDPSILLRKLTLSRQ